MFSAIVNFKNIFKFLYIALYFYKVRERKGKWTCVSPGRQKSKLMSKNFPIEKLFK